VARLAYQARRLVFPQCVAFASSVRDLLIILAGAIVDLKEAVLQLGGDNPDVARSIREVDAQITQFVEVLEGWPKRQ
jgi:hypothetical protein